ncbi:MAG: N-acetyltransferase [Alphaproteobacteria bacterium]|nr:MAG: N-acetyltransferase [Alphaproteobacteria bacterium]
MIDLPPGYELTEDPAAIDAIATHQYLERSYWSPGVPLEIVQRAIRGSLCVAALAHGQQVGFARVVSDRATFGYLADVYVLEEHRGLGLSKAMIAYLQDHPELRDLRRWVLFTADAHGLYKQLGWNELARPQSGMERVFPDIYQR